MTSVCSVTSFSSAMSDLDAEFTSAMSLAKSLDPTSLRSEDKLALYGLQQQATVGPCEARHRPRTGSQDPLARAKFEAWAARQGLTRDEAKEHYITYVRRLCSAADAAGLQSETPRRRPVSGAGPALQDQTTVWHRGHLFKQRDVLKGWRKRYFVLEGGELRYYLRREDINPRGRLHLKGCSASRAGSNTVRGDTFFVLELEKQHGRSAARYRLSTPVRAERERWVEMLSRGIQVAEGDPPARYADSVYTGLESTPGEDEEDNLCAADEALCLAELEGSPLRNSRRPDAGDGVEGGQEGAHSDRTGSEGESGGEEDHEHHHDDADGEEKEGEEDDHVPPEVPPHLRDFIDKGLARLRREGRPEFEGWTYRGVESGVECYVNTSGELASAMGRGEINAPIRAVFEIIADLDARASIDPQFDFGERRHPYDRHTVVDYLAYKRVFPTSVRDFCNLSHWRVERDGSVIVVAQGFEHETCPPVKGNVRGHVEIGGFQLQPLGPRRTHVTYMVQTDLGGSVPAFIVNSVTSKQPLLVKAIRDHAEKADADAYLAKGPVSNRVAPNDPTRGPNAVKPHWSPEELQARQEGEGRRKHRRRHHRRHRKRGGHHQQQQQQQQQQQDAGGEAGAAEQGQRPVPSAPAAALGDNAPPKLPMRRDVLPPAPEGPSLSAFYLAVDLLLPLAVWWWGGALTSRSGVLVVVVALLCLRDLVMRRLGHSRMSARRKIMVGTWRSPTEASIYGTLDVDAAPALEYIQRKRKREGTRVTITHVVIRALAVCMRELPSINGHLAFGHYYPSPTVDIGCLVAVGGGENLGKARIGDADRKSVTSIARELEGKAGTVRRGRDKDFAKQNNVLRMLPPFLVGPLVHTVGYLGCALGFSIPALGVEPYPMGTCMVTSVGSLGLDVTYAPFTPWAHVPLLVAIGAVRDRPVVWDGEVVVRPMLALNATLDHRYIDGAQGGYLANRLRQLLADPDSLDQVSQASTSS